MQKQDKIGFKFDANMVKNHNKKLISLKNDKVFNKIKIFAKDHKKINNRLSNINADLKPVEFNTPGNEQDN